MENKITYVITVSEKFTGLRPKKEYQQIADTGGNDGGPKYGYVNTEEMASDVTDVYTQEVKVIDMPAIIKAVNCL